jgi:hypothetical protein
MTVFIPGCRCIRGYLKGYYQIEETLQAAAQLGDKIQDNGVHAISLAGRRRAVIEHVPEMALATAAEYFDAVQAVGSIRFVTDAGGSGRFKETWPSAVAREFGVGSEETIAAYGAIVGAAAVILIILPGKGSFSGLVSSHLEHTV